MLRIFTITLTFVLLTACTTVPQTLLGDFRQMDSLQQVQSLAEKSSGHIIRWGGVIYKLDNQPDHSLLEIIAFPLDNNTRPLTAQPSHGRFLVRMNRFIDPAVYSHNREVTIIGNVSGIESAKIGEYDYNYPLIEATTVYLWPEPQPTEPYYRDPWYPWAPWYGPYRYHH